MTPKCIAKSVTRDAGKKVIALKGIHDLEKDEF